MHPSRLPLLLTVLLLPLAAAHAAEPSATETAARELLDGLGKQEFQRVYRDHLADRYRERITEEVFIIRYSKGMKQLKSAGSDRTLLEETSMTEISDNQTGKTLTGDFVWLRFKTQYGYGEMHEDVYLERSDDGWRAVGIFIRPVE